MTTLAYRDGVMAADSGGWNGGASHSWARKVAKGPDGTLYGVTGRADECSAFLQWVELGAVGEHPQPEREGDGNSSFAVLVAPSSGGVEIITARGRERYPSAAYFALGAGAPVAFGALFMGATACQAIEAAKEHGEGAHGAVAWVVR